MDFQNFEAWLASWFVRRLALERHIALEAAETLAKDMRQAGIEVDYWAIYERAPEISRRVSQTVRQVLPKGWAKF